LNVDLFAGLEGVGFVVGVELLGPANGLLQERVQVGALDLHDDGLVAFVAHHVPSLRGAASDLNLRFR
jgi:hypothetical protein